MTIKRKPQGLWRRQAGAMTLCAAVLYLVAATAFSADAQSALKTLSQQQELALSILRNQLGDSRHLGSVPASVALAIGQSPLLQAGQTAVEDLRHQEETDDDGGDDNNDDNNSSGSNSGNGSSSGNTNGNNNEKNPAATQPSEPMVTLPEEPVQPAVPLVMADNGVPARTLLPSSTEGYVVTNGVYIHNRSEKTFDESIFDGTFAAALRPEEGPQVLIVHTHGSEAYTMPAGQEYASSGDWRTTDSQYNVVRVGDELAATLEEAGLSVLHDTSLYDYPKYSGAYDRSLEAVKRAMAEHPSISLVLDIHRDAISDSEGNAYKVVSGVAGMNAAQMSFVIGTDGGGLEHPLWQENLKFAAAVQAHILEDYPTLMRPITVRNSRYNQHMSTGSLLVEMGAAGNSLDEALLSARILGQSLAEVILPTTGDAPD